MDVSYACTYVDVHGSSMQKVSCFLLLTLKPYRLSKPCLLEFSGDVGPFHGLAAVACCIACMGFGPGLVCMHFVVMDSLDCHGCHES